jgi:hypothetical protein
MITKERLEELTKIDDMTPERALRSAMFWINTLLNELEVDADEVNIQIAVKNPDSDEEIAVNLSLEMFLEKYEELAGEV